ncbi:MAG: response regulator [Vallitalea sp.]|nr:response regulator [Vallitalea sp.]
MYRILIVDDEQYIIEMLQDLFEFNFSYEELEIFTAINGAIALNLLKIHKIDVLFLDINMPKINGFEVAKQVESNWPDCEIIFLTGSDSFEYIYKASKQKNIKYILKNESDETILKALKDSIISIEANLNSKKIIELSHQRELWIHYLITREVFKDFMNGSDIYKAITANGINHSDFSIDIDKEVYLLYTHIRFTTPNISLIKNKLYLLQIQSYLDQVLQNRFYIELYVKDTSTLLFFLQQRETEFIDRDVNPYVFLSESIDTFGIILTKEFDITPLIMLYDTIMPISSIPNLYRKMDDYYTQNHLKDSLVSSLTIILSEEDLVQKYSKNITLITSKLQEEINSIEFLLYQNNEKKLLPLLDNIYETQFNHKSMHHLPSIEIYQMISLKYLHYINHLQINESLSYKIGLSSLFFLGNFNNWQQAFTYLKKLSKVIVSILTCNACDKNDLLILSIKKHIKSHLKETLTLSSIANHVNYNSSYISRTFKKQTNMSITEYIRKAKVDKAKSDLVNTNKSITEISSELGYETSQYFSITFKKTTGISPTEYRSKNLLNN